MTKPDDVTLLGEIPRPEGFSAPAQNAQRFPTMTTARVEFDSVVGLLSAAPLRRGTRQLRSIDDDDDRAAAEQALRESPDRIPYDEVRRRHGLA